MRTLSSLGLVFCCYLAGLAGLAGCDGESTTSGMGSGASCGGFIGAVCPDSEYCDFAGGMCGAADGTGTCKTRPTSCPGVVQPVCGCDGMIYNNECNAQEAGVDIGQASACQAPAGTFACGTTYCDKAATYCTVFGSDVAGEPSTFACQSLPAGCTGGATCNCVAGEPCGDICAGTLADGFTLTCPGG